MVGDPEKSGTGRGFNRQAGSNVREGQDEAQMARIP